jgi:hypothetical protein
MFVEISNQECAGYSIAQDVSGAVIVTLESLGLN